MNINQQLDRLEQKVDKLLKILGAEGSTRSSSEIKREAMATVLQFRQRQVKNKEK
jgi:hypothetical protein